MRRTFRNVSQGIKFKLKMTNTKKHINKHTICRIISSSLIPDWSHVEAEDVYLGIFQTVSFWTSFWTLRVSSGLVLRLQVWDGVQTSLRRSEAGKLSPDGISHYLHQQLHRLTVSFTISQKDSPDTAVRHLATGPQASSSSSSPKVTNTHLGSK